MAFTNLAEFIEQLHDDGELVRISAEVDSYLEVAAITTRVCQSLRNSPVVFFENVKGRSMPVVTNLLGSEHRLAKALGAASFADVEARIVGMLTPDLPTGWIQALKVIPQVVEFTRIPPQIVKVGDCQQVVKMGRDVDVRDLPVLQSWPHEAAATITAGSVITQNLETGVRNLGLYPLEVCGGDRLAVHWSMHQGGYRNYLSYRQHRQQMPIAVALGGDPSLTFASAAPVPANTDDCLFAGLLRGEGLELVRGRSIEIDVPANAEIILEGLIDTAAAPEPVGPVAQNTGFYGLPVHRPVMQVTAITHRSNPMMPAIIPGQQPSEEFWLRKAAERVFLPFIKLQVPELVDLNWTQSGVGRNILFASIRKSYPGQARKLLHALWGLNELSVAKMIIVVDEDVDVQDEEQVWFRAAANAHPGRDVVFCEGPTHESDHAAPVVGMGHKIGIDATRKCAEEGHPRPWPDALTVSPAIQELVEGRWREYGLE